MNDIRIGGPCPECGLAQAARAEGCKRSRQECSYGKFDQKANASRLAMMLRLFIASQGLEQRAVADDMGISESTLSRFLSGKQNPDGAGFCKIIVWVLFDKGSRA